MEEVRQDQPNSPFRPLKPLSVPFVFSCSPLSEDKERFSPEVDAAVNEMHGPGGAGM